MHSVSLCIGAIVLAGACALSWAGVSIFIAGTQLYRMRHDHHPTACRIGGGLITLIGLIVGYCAIRLGTWLAPSAERLMMPALVFWLCFKGLPALIWLRAIVERFARDQKGKARPRPYVQIIAK